MSLLLRLRARWPRLCAGCSSDDAGKEPLSLRDSMLHVTVSMRKARKFSLTFCAALCGTVRQLELPRITQALSTGEPGRSSLF